MKYEVKIKRLPKSEVEMEATLPAEFLEAARKKALNSLSSSIGVPGFRKGHVPENVVIEKVGEGRILEDAADIVLNDHFHKIIEQEKLDILGRPKISITKLALGNPVEFKATFATMPEFELPGYKKIANEIRVKSNESRKKEDTEATEKEIDDVLLQIRRNKAHFDWHKAHPDEKGHDHPEIKDEDLPEMNDALAKEAGNFKSLDELKAKIKENIEAEKKNRETEKIRAEIMDEILKKTEVDLPQILIDSEIEKSLAQLKGDVERMGTDFEEYLKQTQKSVETLKKDLSESSEKRAKLQLIFNKIAAAEKIYPDEKIMEHEVSELKKYYPTAPEQNLRIYVATLLINQAVLKLLESQ